MNKTIRLDLRTDEPIEELNSRNRRIASESSFDETSKAPSRVGRIRAVLDTVGVPLLDQPKPLGYCTHESRVRFGGHWGRDLRFHK
jgi:hypothetical protein